MSKTVIWVDNLSKRYRIGLKEQKHDSLSGQFIDFVKRPMENLRNLKKLTTFTKENEADIIWALRDVSFEINEGDIFGIVGRNGAGKTTLLKIISRIVKPSVGRVKINGNVGALLEVGTGFHPELTGRENIYLNGAILGMKRAEINRKFDQIIAFSGVEKFLDTPVKRYSSGMQIRLAFSVAAHLEPEILLIDEVLAVGDIEFQKKCLGKMQEVSRSQRTVLFVSHNIGLVRTLCTKGMYLVNGKIREIGSIDTVCNAYIKDVKLQEETCLSKGVSVKLALKDINGGELQEWGFSEEMIVEVRIDSVKELHSPAVDLSLYSNNGTWITAVRSDMMTEHLNGTRLYSFKLCFKFKNTGLAVHEIYLDVGVRAGGGTKYIALIQSAAVIPISQSKLPRYNVSDTICYLPVEVKIEI
ncbi:MAG: ABC transporter ATP-binding protein [Candidatus Scalindua sp.]